MTWKPPATLKLTVHRFCKELARMGIRCERVLLFGSWATGRATEGSDIDLIVVSPDWAPYSERERLEMLGVAAARILEPVQARGVTPEELEGQRLSLFWQQIIREQAVEIA